MNNPLRLALVLCLTGATLSVRAALPVPDADNGGIILPPGFRAVVFADNLVAGQKVGNNNNNLRFLAIAANGDVYAKTSAGGIIALRDADGDGRAEIKQVFGDGGGTGIALHGDWRYHSTNDGVFRYKWKLGELVPSGTQETVISGLPNGHQHEAKSFAFGGDGQLYVEVGSPSNSYGNPDRAYIPPGTPSKDPTEFLQTHGGFWRFNPDKLNQTQADGFHFSTGHRHSLALAWNAISQNFFMVMMGRDQLNMVDPVHYDALDNAERVAEEMHLLREGVNLGWPYTYYDPIKKARMVSPEFGGDNVKRAPAGQYDEPLIAFPAHWAPLQMAFYNGTQFPAKYRGGAFIAFHGSWNRAPRSQAGYKVVYVPFDDKGMPRGDYEVFADNFAGREEFTNPGDARFRPGGLAVGPDGSLYVGDTDKGRIWRIIYTGETAPAGGAKALTTLPETAAPVTVNVLHPRGQALYAQTCAACHMAEGNGVSGLQPPLLGSATVKGDTTQLIRVLLRGPAAVQPADRAKYSNIMPPFAFLTDQQIADVLSHVRQVFGSGASAVTPAQVAAVRAAPQ